MLTVMGGLRRNSDRLISIPSLLLLSSRAAGRRSDIACLRLPTQSMTKLALSASRVA